MFKRSYFFFHYCQLSGRCVMFQKQCFSSTKMWAQAAFRGLGERSGSGIWGRFPSGVRGRESEAFALSMFARVK